MVHKTLTRFFHDKHVMSVRALFLPDGKIEYSHIEIRKEKEGIIILSQIQSESEEGLFEKLKKNIPIVICISGKGILSKKFQASQTVQASQLLPGVKEDDFYIQKHFLDEAHVLVSVVRKNQADTILPRFTKNGYQVVDLLIGPPGEDLAFPNMSSLMEIKTDKECRMAFSAGINWLLGGDEREWSNELALQLQNEYKEKKLFKASAVGVLSVIFSVLFVNFLFFSHYNSKLWELSAKASQTGSLSQEANALQEKLKEKEMLLSGLGLMVPARQSYYADQLAMELPDEIRLRSMNLFPVEKQSGSEELKFGKDIIMITGKCRENTALAGWMEKLRSKEWIKEVSLLNLNQQTLKEDGVFSVRITI